MSKEKTRFTAILIFSILFLCWVSVSAVSSNTVFSINYPLTPIIPTIYDQITPNWCGPGSLQSVIQYVNQYNNGAPAVTVVPIIPKATLWAFIRDTPSSALGGRDNPLPGVVGDGYNEVRKLNIAYDMGADPHAMAWTMWTHTGNGYYYHYWIYYDSAIIATKTILYTIEKYHEPVIAAVWAGLTCPKNMYQLLC